MTHWESRQRRKKIADYVKSGHSTTEASAEFHVRQSLVAQSCAENGVTLQYKMIKSGYKVIALLQNTDYSLREIGRQCQISHERVRQILAKAKEGGILFPNRS